MICAMPMGRVRIVCVALAMASSVPTVAWAQTPPGSSSGPSRTITTDRGAVGDLLRKWAADGSAAGNTGDYYDNRDRGHSLLDVSVYPQLRLIPYSAEDRKTGGDWAAARAIRPGVVFGNSSTSSTAPLSGSNTRMLYASRAGLDLLYEQYRRHNLYIYPAHQDHSPGHNGIAGGMYGDLLPANTPYVITSQGSSGSDQPFLRAVAFTLAAFRPEVKAKLISSGMLMPTLQMVFRMSNKQVATEAEYLTGKAHPTAFDGAQVDVARMVGLAHGIDLAHIPPLAQLEITGIEPAQPGSDYFDPAPSEALGTTPCAIARIFRSSTGVRRMIVSAASSIDLNALPLSYRWVLLRGDPSEVRITPRGSGAEAEIAISYHKRAPIAPGAVLESNRVDIGVFAYNGTYYSAPAFITSYTLDTEARTYDAKGIPIEIGYGMGESALTIDNWAAYFEAIKAQPLSPALQLLHRGLSADDMKMIRSVGERYLAGRETLNPLEQRLKDAEESLKKMPAEGRPGIEQEIKSARDALDLATKSRDVLLSTAQPGMSQSLQAVLRPRLQALLSDPLLYPQNAATFGRLSPALEQQRRRLLGYGIITESAGQNFIIAPVLSGTEPPEQRLSRYQRTMIARFNGDLLASLIPGARHEFRTNLVDYRLTLPKTWRDLYHHGPAGEVTGWTRCDGQGSTDFTADSNMVVTRDPLGRPLVGRSVTYEQRAPKGYDPRSGPDPTPLSFSPGGRFAYYAYTSDTDTVGRVARIEDRAQK